MFRSAATKTPQSCRCVLRACGHAPHVTYISRCAHVTCWTQSQASPRPSSLTFARRPSSLTFARRPSPRQAPVQGQPQAITLLSSHVCRTTLNLFCLARLVLEFFCVPCCALFALMWSFWCRSHDVIFFGLTHVLAICRFRGWSSRGRCGAQRCHSHSRCGALGTLSVLRSGDVRL